MIPKNFAYHKAGSVDEALSLLQTHNGDAKILAGGHSLIPALKLRLNQPEVLIDIAKIAELSGIRQEGSEIVIGAGTTHGAIADSALMQGALAMYAEAASMIGDLQVRNMGTIGGSIAHADPAADWPAVLLASDASVVMVGSGGSRTVAATDFFTGFYETALGEGELITEIRVPVPAANSKSTYQKFMQPASRFALVGCAAMVTMDGDTCSDIRVAFAGVSDTAFRDAAVEDALRGQATTAANINAAAANAASESDRFINQDHFASEEYRRHLAKVYAKRALAAIG